MPAFLLRAPGLVPSILPGVKLTQNAELSLRHHQSRYTKPPVHAWSSINPQTSSPHFPFLSSGLGKRAYAA